VVWVVDKETEQVLCGSVPENIDDPVNIKL
jgi:hypothetical protein